MALNKFQIYKEYPGGGNGGERTAVVIEFLLNE
jgi:hypothetical protein